MKTFNQLHEAFSNPYSWKWTSKDDERWIANFPEVKGQAEVHLIDNDLVGYTFEIDGSMGVTGKGDGFRIFATAIEILVDYIRKEKPKQINFSAEKYNFAAKKKTNRNRLYTRMIKKYVPKEYKLNMTNTEYDTIFHLKRK